MSTSTSPPAPSTEDTADLVFSRDGSINTTDAGNEFLAGLGDDRAIWRDRGGYFELAQDVAADDIAYQAVAAELAVAFVDNVQPGDNPNGHVIEASLKDDDGVGSVDFIRAKHPDNRDFQADWNGVRGELTDYQAEDIYNALRRLGWSLDFLQATIYVSD